MKATETTIGPTLTVGEVLEPQGTPELPLYVGGEWAGAADGATFESYEPATGRAWARVAEAGPDDVGRAVAAARSAFEGPWSRVNAADRARLLLRMAGVVDAHREELALVETRDNGKALRETNAELRRDRPLLRVLRRRRPVLVRRDDARPTAGPSSPTRGASRSAWSARSSPGTRR